MADNINNEALTKEETEERIVEVLKTVYDPEIPVNIYDLGLIYKIDLEGSEVTIDMTFTAPSCPMAAFILDDVKQKIEGITGIPKATVTLVYEPEWSRDMMSEEAKLELGLL